MLKPSDVLALKKLIQIKIGLPITFTGDKFDAFLLGVQQTFDLFVSLHQLGLKHAKKDDAKQADRGSLRGS